MTEPALRLALNSLGLSPIAAAAHLSLELGRTVQVDYIRRAAAGNFAAHADILAAIAGWQEYPETAPPPGVVLLERKHQAVAHGETLRRCMGRDKNGTDCRAEFRSWGPGNRMCPQCRSRW